MARPRHPPRRAVVPGSLDRCARSSARD